MNNKIKNIQDLNELVAKSENKRVALLAVDLPDDVIKKIKLATVPKEYNYLDLEVYDI